MFYEDKQFIKHLDTWLDISDQKSAKWLDSYRGKIPPMFLSYSSKLYRGFILDRIPTGKIDIKDYTSWSKDKNTAIKFLNDPAFRVSRKQGVTVLASKSITSTKIVLNIHDLAMFLGTSGMIDLGIDDMSADSALKEKEVLVKPISLMPTELTLIK